MKSILTAAASTAALLLAACGQPADEEAGAPPADAGETAETAETAGMTEPTRAMTGEETADARNAAAGLALEAAWLRTPPGGGDVTAGYLTLTSESDDALTGAESPLAERIELHTHMNDGGVMRMRPVDRIALPRNEPVVLQPGGLHLMVFGVDPAAVEAGEAPVTLMFASGARLEVMMPIADAAPMGEAGDAGAMDHGDMDHGDMDHGDMDAGDADAAAGEPDAEAAGEAPGR